MVRVEDNEEIDVINGTEFWGRKRKAGVNQWQKIDIYTQLGGVRQCPKTSRVQL